MNTRQSRLSNLVISGKQTGGARVSQAERTIKSSCDHEDDNGGGGGGGGGGRNKGNCSGGDGGRLHPRQRISMGP